MLISVLFYREERAKKSLPLQQLQQTQPIPDAGTSGTSVAEVHTVSGNLHTADDDECAVISSNTAELNSSRETCLYWTGF